jgi:hypothetical protein
VIWPPKLPHSKKPLEYPPMFQFGQPGVSYKLGKTACTDTCIQMIIQFFKDRTITLNRIREVSGSGIDGVHGLTVSETLKVLNYYGVFYRYQPNITATQALQKAYLGPVIVGIAYRTYPVKKGGGCLQKNLAKVGGKTDCYFKGAHAILVVGNKAVKNSAGKVVSYDAFTRDPDHHTGTTDRITGRQLTETIKSLVGTDRWQNTFMLYPTRKK